MKLNILWSTFFTATTKEELTNKSYPSDFSGQILFNLTLIPNNSDLKQP